MEITSQNESEIVSLARDGNANAMELVFEKYKSTVKAIARSYYLVGGDEDDLIQEGTIGVFRAVKSYKGDAPFKPYAIKCIKTAIISIVRHDLAQKNIPLNKSVSISGGEESDADKSSIVIDDRFQPELEYLKSEAESELKEKIVQNLSSYEISVLSLYLNGFSYADISNKLQKPQKSIDNALQRIRKKILLVI